MNKRLHVLLLLLAPSKILSFAPVGRHGAKLISNSFNKHESIITALKCSETDQTNQRQQDDEDDDETTSIYIDSTLTDDRVRSLFAWISRAFAGEPSYNNLMYAMAAIFGASANTPPALTQMAKDAVDLLPTTEETPTGEPLPLSIRERSSLGAMGAGQWMGQFKTRPHSLLDVSNITSVDEWVKTLPRGCRRTLKKANAQNFTVVTRPIRDREPAPHSSLPHFRCVVEHEVRLITRYDGDTEGFLQALSMSVGRYVETTNMVGEIQEYRNAEGRVIAFAHEIRKGRAIRGQWFYASDEAAKSYVWFHSVQEMVRRAIEAEGVDVADLGPSGGDKFTELKAKYGFEAVDDWPAVADYTGPFYHGDQGDAKNINNKDQTIIDLMKLLGK